MEKNMRTGVAHIFSVVKWQLFKCDYSSKEDFPWSTRCLESLWDFFSWTRKEFLTVIIKIQLTHVLHVQYCWDAKGEHWTSATLWQLLLGCQCRITADRKSWPFKDSLQMLICFNTLKLQANGLWNPDTGWYFVFILYLCDIYLCKLIFFSFNKNCPQSKGETVQICCGKAIICFTILIHILSFPFRKLHSSMFTHFWEIFHLHCYSVIQYLIFYFYPQIFGNTQR